MRSAAAAIAWEFRQRHRWGLIALLGYLLVLTAIRLLNLEPGGSVNLDDSWSFALVVVVPLTVTFMYLLAVFTYGLSGDLAARQSTYPARMFTLPVTTAALAGWPMLYGTVAMAILWLAMRFLAVWPSGFPIPVIWPVLLAAALLAWTQALMWMPYGLRGLRVIVAMLWLATIDAVVLLALHYNARETVMVAGLAPLAPLAYLVARFAVARGRRGDVPDWWGAFARVGQIAEIQPNRRAYFPSPARAQAWFEWRRHGRSLPALVVMVLPFELALLFGASDSPVLVFVVLIGVLLTPPFMAGFAAATVSKSNPYVSDSYGVTPFIATRPMTSADLIAAKLNATIWSTLATWLFVLLAIPLALTLSETWPVVTERYSRLSGAIGTPRAVVIVLLTISGLIAATWKQLVQTLYIGLTGREWLIKGSVFLTLAFLVVIGPIVDWIISNGDVQAALWDALPPIAAVLVFIKMSAAVWIVTRLYQSRLLSDRTLVTGAACWCIVVLALYGLLVWFFSTPFFPRYLLALVAILAVPLARLSAAPLALAWNRHR
ncbi:MAG: hypothetical protein ABI469_09115 [Gemmatimonadales bacterium]